MIEYEHAVTMGYCYRLDRQLRHTMNVAVSTAHYNQKSQTELEQIRELLVDELNGLLGGQHG